MEERHKEVIRSNLSFLCQDVDYTRFRPQLIKHRLFPERQLRLMEEKVGNIKLEVFMQAQRRGPTAFRRLLASLKFSGWDVAGSLDISRQMEDKTVLVFRQTGSITALNQKPGAVTQVENIKYNINSTYFPPLDGGLGLHQLS